MPLFAEESVSRFTQVQLAPLWEDYGIPLAVMGIVVVFATLVLMTLFITLLPRVMAVLGSFFPEEKELAAATEVRRGDDHLDQETMVVIAAAVAETIDQPHRILHTRELTAEDLAWSLEGRLQHHASHRTPPRERW